MSVLETLKQRAENKCELCSATEDLDLFVVSGGEGEGADTATLLCGHCRDQIVADSDLDQNHWRCLNDSMWSQVPAVQVMAYRMLHRLSSETWAQDLLEMLYLEEDVAKWAKSGVQDEDAPVAKDSNGVLLHPGDTVTIIKDLPVKGAGFTAKRGTAVRNIGITPDPTHIEGRVNGQRIQIKCEFVKKQ